ncbi:MAG: HAD family hydrolase [Micropepsaceae bacterium]
MHAAEDAPLPPPVVYDFAPVARELLVCDSRAALLNGGKGADIRKALDREIEKAAPRVLSFDVFDTFLLRNNKPETARYLELSARIAERLAGAVPKPPADIDLLLARLQGMAFSYRTRKAVDGCREGHIEQVVRYARAALNLPRETEDTFLAAELDYETANLTVNPILAAVASAFRARGGKVILVSDMYLGAKEINLILTRLSNGVNNWYDKIYSSADHVLSKRSGKIFPFIEKDLSVPGKEFLHIGDAWEGDIVRPREAGWNALHFPISTRETGARESALRVFVGDLKTRGHDLTQWARV